MNRRRTSFSLTGTLLVLMVLQASGQERIEGLHYQTGKPVVVTMHEGMIVSVRPVRKLTGGNRHLMIAPGLIDNQVNGYAGITFAFGGGELTPEGIRKATRELWKKGVTSYLATLTTNSRELLEKNLKLLAGMKNDPELKGSLAGIHMEGPYISPEDGYRGAHPVPHIRKPDWDEFNGLYKASEENIVTVTLAPEQEGALDMITRLTNLGIIVAIGHHNASAPIISQAVRNGARIATHLGNGCANMINRHDNVLWPQLANDQLMISIICDGFHLRDDEIASFYRIKGPERTILTSDVTGFAGLEPGFYTVDEGDTIELTPEGMLRYPARNVLYGSALTISRGVVHIMHVTGCSLADAIRMASENPARLYGWNDRGTLSPGKRADLILFNIGERELNIRKTFVAGELVYEAAR